MEEREAKIKFKELCSNLRIKGIKRTDKEFFEIMINLIKEHFKK
jgi:hypothetical protein